MHRVDTVSHCADLLRRGIANRITSATTMNAHSSRSHAVFTIWYIIYSKINYKGELLLFFCGKLICRLTVKYMDPSGNQHQRRGKLNLVDLAGSERHGKTGIRFINYFLK